MKKYLAVLLLISSTCIAQNPDIKRTYHWYFGDRNGVDFTSGTPVVDTVNQMHSVEGCAVISDTCGQLLFYTNGDTVWNKNHQVMPNGTGIISGWSSTQRALIVPQPLSNNIYYLFTTTHVNQIPNGMYYSIIDMNAAGGLGDVTTLNNLLLTPTTEKLCATQHSNGQDFWILGHKQYSNEFHGFLLSSAGINTTPVITTIGAGSVALGDGYMRFSPNGNKVGAAYHTGSSGDIDTVDIYDFDNTNGTLSNAVSLVQGMPGEVYGLCFSPDNSKLFTSMFFSNPNFQNIYQFDLSSGNPAVIQSSDTLIISSDSTIYYAIQLRPDGKIFVREQSYSNVNSDSLATILNPNIYGTGCNFIEHDFFLINASHPPYGSIGLPNFVDSYFSSAWQPICNVGIAEEDIENNDNELIITPNPISDYAIIHIPKDLKNHDCLLTVCNSLGQIVLNKKFINDSGELVLKKEALSSGIYLLKILSNNITYSSKFIINN